LERAHFENWVTRHGMRQWKIIIEGQSRKWSRDVMFLDRKQCRLANGTWKALMGSRGCTMGPIVV